VTFVWSSVSVGFGVEIEISALGVSLCFGGTERTGDSRLGGGGACSVTLLTFPYYSQSSPLSNSSPIPMPVE
jgi:hypothetical protein